MDLSFTPPFRKWNLQNCAESLNQACHHRMKRKLTRRESALMRHAAKRAVEHYEKTQRIWVRAGTGHIISRMTLAELRCFNVLDQVEPFTITIGPRCNIGVSQLC